MKQTNIKLFGILLAAALSVNPVSAAGTDTWVGNTDANWNSAANWTTVGGSTPPANGDSLVFGAAGSAGAALNNNISGLLVNNLDFSSGASAFTMSGNGLTLNGTLTDNASVNQAIGSGIILGSFFTAIKNTGSGTLDLGALTQTAGSGGSVNFTPTGTIHTTTVNNNGILGGWATVGNAGTTGASGDWAAVDGSGNIITYAGYTTITASQGAGSYSAQNWKVPSSSANNLALTSSATVNSLVLGQDFSISSGATMTLGSGGLILSGASRYFKNNGNSDLVGTAQLTSGLASGELFVDSSGSGGSGDNDWRIYPKIVNGSANVILVKNGPGYLRLENANTYSGGTILNGGTLYLDNASAISTGPITLNAGTVINANSSINFAGNVAVNGIIGFYGTANYTYSGAITGSGTLDSTVAIGGASGNITGDISGFFGTIKHTSDTTHNNLNAGGSTANSVNASQAKFVLSGTSGASRRLSVNGSGGTFLLGDLSGASGSLLLNNSLAVGYLGLNSTYGGQMILGSVTPAVTKVGTGSLTLSGASTYTGVSAVQNGSLISGAAVAVSTAGPFGNASSAIIIGDASTISSATAMNPQLLIGGVFTMARTVTVGANNNALGNASTTFALGGNTANSSTFSGLITLNQSLTVTQVVSGTLNITAGITSGSSGTQTVTVNNPGTVNIGTVAIGGGTGTIGLTKSGNGTLTLTGTHTYTGNTAVNGGTLLVNGSIASGSTVSVSGSGSILGGSGTVNGPATISSSGALTPRTSGGSATTLTFGGNLTLTSASANLTLSTTSGGSNDKVNFGGSSTLTLDSSDTINVAGTTFDVAADYTLFTSTGGTVSMATTPTLKINGVTSDQTSAGNYKLQISGDGHSLLLHYIAAATPPTVNSSSATPTSLGHYQTTTVTVNATPAAGKSITSVTVGVDGLAGTGNPVTLTGPGGDGTGNWTGTFAASGALAAGSYTISGAVNQSDGGVAVWSVSGITVTNASPVWSGGGGDNKWSNTANWNAGSGPAPGSGDVVVFDGSTQTINNLDHSFSAVSLTFNSGAGSFTITNDSSTLTLSAGMTNNSASAQTLDVAVGLTGTPTINAAAGDIAMSRVVSDAGGGFTKSGNGMLTLFGANTYSGPTTIGGGTLTISGAGQLGGGSYGALITNNGTLNLNSSASQTLSGAISGTGKLVKNGAGTLTLSAANSYGGGTTNAAGTLTVGNGNALGTGLLTLNGGTVINGGALDMAIGNNIEVRSGGGTITLGVAKNVDLNGAVSGSGNLTLGGPNPLSSLNLNFSANTASGTITIPNSTANNQTVTRFKTTTAGSATAAWSIGGAQDRGTTLDFGTGTIEFGSLSGSGIIQGNATGVKTLSVGALGTDSPAFSGSIRDVTGTVALTKVGAGKLTLSGANTYTGNTTVSNGTLALSGSGSLASLNLAVATSGKFDVSALTAGSYLLNASGTLALAISNNVTTGTTQGQMLIGAKSLTYGGNLIVTATGDALTAGKSFPLVVTNGTAGQLTGWFSSVNLPSLSSGLSWDTNNLATSGVLDVYTFSTTALEMSTRVNSNAVVSAPKLANHASSGRAALAYPTGWKTTATTPINGGSVLVNGDGSLTYTPAGAANVNGGSDSFTVTFQDGHGSQTMAVNVSVGTSNSGGQSPNVLSSGTDGSGNFYALFAGLPNTSYTVQTNSVVSGPTWVKYGNYTTGNDGLINVTNVPPVTGSLFFRTVYPSY